MRLSPPSPWRHVQRIASAALVIAAALIAYGHHTNFWSHFTEPSIARCVTDFFLGYLTYYVWKKWPLKHAPIIGTILEIGTFIVAFALAQMAAKGLLYVSTSFLFAIMVWAFASEQGLGSKLMRTPVMAWLGSISLAVYLVHVPVLRIFQASVHFAEKITGLPLYAEVVVSTGEVKSVIDFGGVWTMNAMSLALMAIIIGAAWLAHTRIEASARAYFANLADRIYGRVRPPAAEAA